jgi:hypothetical protein
VKLDRPKLIAIDFETTEVPFFDKRNKKACNWAGHPRLAKAKIISFKSHAPAVATTEIAASTLPPFDILVFHNASFDIQIGINAGVWIEPQFR